MQTGKLHILRKTKMTQEYDFINALLLQFINVAPGGLDLVQEGNFITWPGGFHGFFLNIDSNDSNPFTVNLPNNIRRPFPRKYIAGNRV